MNFNWLDKNEYPFQSRYFAINGHRLHYIDEGKGPVLLFVHGTPSWSFDFRNVIKKLRTNFRCIAIDHIGFGMSDKPSDYNYSTQNHSKTLDSFIVALGLKDITFVLHDFGGPIGLNVAISHPELVKRFVILNSWAWSTETEPEYKKMLKILKSPLLPFLYEFFNFSACVVMPASFGTHKLTPALRKQYTRPFANSSQRKGTLAFARSLVNDQGWFKKLWDSKAAIANKPTLLLWGMKDPVLPPRYLDKFATGFTNNSVFKLESAGHFPQEEAPEQVAKAIKEFLIVT